MGQITLKKGGEVFFLIIVALLFNASAELSVSAPIVSITEETGSGNAIGEYVWVRNSGETDYRIWDVIPVIDGVEGGKVGFKVEGKVVFQACYPETVPKFYPELKDIDIKAGDSLKLFCWKVFQTQKLEGESLFAMVKIRAVVIATKGTQAEQWDSVSVVVAGESIFKGPGIILSSSRRVINGFQARYSYDILGRRKRALIMFGSKKDLILTKAIK